MPEHPLQSLIDAPLANATKINLPMGRRAAPRVKAEPRQPRPGDLTPAQVRERKAKALSDKQEKLLDYYATTSIPAERVAEHIGLYRVVQIGVDEETHKPITERVLDVQQVESALAWRRKSA